MSLYENYAQTAGHYDSTRSATGSEIWLGHLISHFGDLRGVRMLDAGCGTGNYALEMARHVGQVTALDMNQQMLAEARTKAAAVPHGDRIEFRNGQLLDLPFADGSFDAVMFNQVLHHLARPGEAGFPGCRGALQQAARVLRPGGVVFVNMCSRTQMRRGFWYASLIPEARDRVIERTIPSRELRIALQETGFGAASRTVPLDTLLLGAAALDAKGPLDTGWRAGDSIWALAAEDELARALAKISGMQRSGTLQEYVREHDRDRPDVGQVTFWCAVQPA